MRFRAICLTIYSLLWALNASALEVCGELKQGELILFKQIGAQKIILRNNLNTKEYAVASDGVVLAALHRDAPDLMNLEVLSDNAAITRYTLPITRTVWDIQRINGVTQSKVTPTSAADLKEIKREQRDLGRAITNYESGDAWREGFIVPVDGKISGNFGNQRIFNGIPKNSHSGIDIAALEGTAVKASGDGKVILSGNDYFYTGNMVIIDHGQGLQTIYAHLKEAKVKEGDRVKKGDIIGLVGKTGRATGSHLHWGASLNNVRFRPHALLEINKKKCRIIEEKH